MTEEDNEAATEKWGGIDVLKDLATKAINALYNKEEPLKKGELYYTALDLVEVYHHYDVQEIWETSGAVRETIRDYCSTHHIAPADLARVGGKVFIGDVGSKKEADANTPLVIFFPIYRGGISVAGWGRVFNEKKADGKPWKWRGYGFSTGNGALLYTTALPLAAFAMTKEKAETAPLVLVESPTDAIRLGRIGWWAVALGGHSITQKGREELARMPQEKIIVMLDSDAKEETIKVVTKIQSFKKRVIPVFIHGKGESYIVDPCDLDDRQLRGFLLKTLQETRNET